MPSDPNKTQLIVKTKSFHTPHCHRLLLWPQFGRKVHLHNLTECQGVVSVLTFVQCHAKIGLMQFAASSATDQCAVRKLVSSHHVR
ncbi:hypothetical protein DPMN_126924 [Dreissena polymorpha]|uniref:Uncharacterized protein n=1 Tax=Dreissena polymorpha TaxID=45954 RepID=A0A9D4H490_DREPO|nr:hypothetical protein DPMN_126924 [Dreissena polymorpha]